MLVSYTSPLPALILLPPALLPCVLLVHAEAYCNATQSVKFWQSWNLLSSVQVQWACPITWAYKKNPLATFNPYYWHVSFTLVFLSSCTWNCMAILHPTKSGSLKRQFQADLPWVAKQQTKKNRVQWTCCENYLQPSHKSAPFYQPHLVKLAVHRCECFTELCDIRSPAFHVLVPSTRREWIQNVNSELIWNLKYFGVAFAHPL